MSEQRRPLLAGFSLVELMVAMAVGLMLTLGVLQVFLASKESFALQQRSAAMQENARFLLGRLAQDIRLAGQFGCLELRRLPASMRATVPAELASPIDYRQDVLRLITALPVAAAAPQELVSAADYAARWLLVSNCLDKLKVVEADTEVEVAAGDLLIPLRLLEYRQQGTRIQVRTNGRGNFETLIEGVASFVLAFGLASDAEAVGVVGAYRDSFSAAEAERVRSVRVALQLSERPAAKTQQGVQSQRYVQVTAVRNRLD
ncbi:MAG: prepilin-type N-terminal cleavage/methylation domain-containing protein [Halopseudomonas sp.]|uniref:PilW family protein n=1 Tax=Halopseudomonas sp. TaxID=2901191 RepID=UPI003001070C